MVSFERFTKLFSGDLPPAACVEIEFSLIGTDFRNCWMGKGHDAADPEKAVYWFGLAADGSAAYDFDTFAAFAGAPVFNGKSLEEMWDRVVLHSVDGCDPDEHPGWSM